MVSDNSFYIGKKIISTKFHIYIWNTFCIEQQELFLNLHLWFWCIWVCIELGSVFRCVVICWVLCTDVCRAVSDLHIFINEKNICSFGAQMLLISSHQERNDLLFEFSSFEDSSKTQQDYSEEACFQFFVYKMGFYTMAFWLFSVTRHVIASNPNKLSCIKPTNTECCGIWGPQSALWGQRRRTVCNTLLLGTYCWMWETTQRDGSTSEAMEHFLWPKDCVAHSHTSQPRIAVLARPPSVLWGEGRLHNANMMRWISSLGASDRSFRVFIMWL